MGKRKRKVFICINEFSDGFIVFCDLIPAQGESGMATSYISRNQALKKLQLSLPDFRCCKKVLCLIVIMHYYTQQGWSPPQAVIV